MINLTVSYTLYIHILSISMSRSVKLRWDNIHRSQIMHNTSGTKIIYMVNGLMLRLALINMLNKYRLLCFSVDETRIRTMRWDISLASKKTLQFSTASKYENNVEMRDSDCKSYAKNFIYASVTSNDDRCTEGT